MFNYSFKIIADPPLRKAQLLIIQPVNFLVLAPLKIKWMNFNLQVVHLRFIITLDVEVW